MNGDSKNQDDHLPVLVDQLEQIVQLQTKEIELKQAELASDERNNEKVLEYAKQELEARIQVNADQGKTVIKLNRYRYIFWGGMALMATSICFYLIYKDQSAIVEEMVKILVSLASGFLAGWGYAKIPKK